jgi:hypothetical protein
MGAVFLFAIVIGIFAALDVAAYLWGADSRRTAPDTHGNTDLTGIL